MVRRGSSTSSKGACPWAAAVCLLLAALLSACGARTSLGGLMGREGSSAGGASPTDGTSTSGGHSSAGDHGAGGGAPSTGGAQGLPHRPDGHAPDPQREPPEFCTRDGWCGANADFVAISSTSESDIWILANDTGRLEPAAEPFEPNEPARSAILHWDGVGWTAMQPEPELLEAGLGLRSLAAGSEDVWAVGDAGVTLSFRSQKGSARLPLETKVTCVSVSPRGDLWFGYSGPDLGVRAADGLRWSPIVSSDLGLTGIWADEDGAWIVGPELVGRFTAGAEHVTQHPASFRQIWGADPEHGYSVGPAGALARVAASGTWRLDATTPPTRDIDYRAVGGHSAEDVWAVGTLGTLAHFDGRAWTASSAGTEQTLNGVWAYGGKTWVVGDAGTFLVLEDGSWRSSRPTEQPLRALWGAAPNDVWAVGDDIAHWDGDSWQSVPHPEAELLTVSGSRVADVWAGGRGGALLHWDGVSWTQSSTTSTADITGLWVESSGTVWAVDSAGSVRFSSKGGWAGWTASLGALRGIMGNHARDVIVIGDLGRALVDEAGVDVPLLARGSYSLIFGDGKHIWTAGSVTWGAYKAGGAYPALGRWDGETFVDDLEPSHAGLPWNPVLAGWARGVDDVWLALPHLMHWDGLDWRASSLGGGERAEALFGVQGDLWAITERGTLVRHTLR